jgi:hypothetical protein
MGYMSRQTLGSDTIEHIDYEGNKRQVVSQRRHKGVQIRIYDARGLNALISRKTFNS